MKIPTGSELYALPGGDFNFKYPVFLISLI